MLVGVGGGFANELGGERQEHVTQDESANDGLGALLCVPNYRPIKIEVVECLTNGL